MLLHMRTTLNLNDELMRAVKQRAAARGQTVTRVFEDALRRALEPAPPAAHPFKLDLPEGRQRTKATAAAGSTLNEAPEQSSVGRYSTSSRSVETSSITRPSAPGENG